MNHIDPLILFAFVFGNVALMVLLKVVLKGTWFRKQPERNAKRIRVLKLLFIASFCCWIFCILFCIADGLMSLYSASKLAHSTFDWHHASLFALILGAAIYSSILILSEISEERRLVEKENGKTAPQLPI